VLNRGAVFMKYSYKKGSVGVRSKSERLVWLSGDNKITWKETVTSPAGRDPPSSSLASGSDSAVRLHGISIADVMSISTTPPMQYGGAEDRSLYIVSKTRSLLLEASDSMERDFWFTQLSEIISAQQAQLREMKRQAKLAQRDTDMSARRQRWLDQVREYESAALLLSPHALLTHPSLHARACMHARVARRARHAIVCESYQEARLAQVESLHRIK